MSTNRKQQLSDLLGRYGEMKNKEKLAIEPQEMPEQAAEIRRRNIDEVPLGYDEISARMEAMRCLECPTKPCIKGCPVEIDIPGFIVAIREGDYPKAISIIREANCLPAVTGRVCPQEVQCQAFCTVGKAKKNPELAVSVGRLERFVADWERTHNAFQEGPKAPATGKRVAVVGAGPAGLTVAGDLIRLGHDVTIFEAFHKGGGVLVYGIPEFRLPKAIVQLEIDKLEAMGVKVELNSVVGSTISVQELLDEEGFQAVFVGTGAGLPYFMRIPGEELIGVYSANEYLTRANLMQAYQFPLTDTPTVRSRKVAVFGGGNVAMDSARTALRLGAEEVYLVYRRSMEEMPARREEIHHAEEEGIHMRLLCNPVNILGDEHGNVKGVTCLRMELGEPDASGRRRPVPVEGSEFVVEADTVVVSIGNGANPLLTEATPEIKLNKWGNIVAEEGSGRTSMPGVYAGGDIVIGAATVILAMGAGKSAALAIHEDLMGKEVA